MDRENSNSDAYLPGLGRLADQRRSIMQFFRESRLQKSPVSDMVKRELMDNQGPLQYELFTDELNVLLGVE